MKLWASILFVLTFVVSSAYAQNENSTKAAELTVLWESGAQGEKINLVVIGDGFLDSEIDQNQFNNYVSNEVVSGLFNYELLRDTKGAFNLYRVNTFSNDSGMTQVDGTGTVTIARSTALDYRVNGMWANCWNQPGPDSSDFRDEILDDLVPGWDVVMVVLNEPGGGGCRRGSVVSIHLGSGRSVVHHELGHAVGLLCDEYTAASPTDYNGSEPSCVNLTTDIDDLKWDEYVDPATPIATVFDSTTMTSTETAGAFVGGTTSAGNTFNSGIWHPTDDSTMNGNRAALGPVNYEGYRKEIDSYLNYTFDDTVTGDFNGDGRSDIVIQDDVSLWLHLSTGNHLDNSWAAAERIPGSWQFKDADQLFVGDFDGDGMDDLFIVNLVDWNKPYLAMIRSTGTSFELAKRYDQKLPGWDDMRRNDQFYVADFDGDGLDDLYVLNAQDWKVGYLGMLRSTGSRLVMNRRYDKTLPGWDDIRRNDTIYVGDFNGDQLEDIYIFNGTDWSVGYLGMLSASANSLSMSKRYDRELPGWDDMRVNDQFYAADFDADGLKDIYVVNTRDWNVGYLGMLKSRESSVVMVNRYDEEVPGWDDLEPGDQFYAADVDGDIDEDLYVYNATDWSSEYLGILNSNTKELSGSWQRDRIGGWNLGKVDRFLVGNFNGLGGWDDLFVYNSEWFGMLRSRTGSVVLDSIFRWWINEVEYHEFGWWQD